MLKIPENTERLKEFCKEMVDECMATAEERSMLYTKAAQYYYTGSSDVRAAIHNKVRTFIDRLAGFYYQPANVRFNVVFDSSEQPDILERGQTAARMLTAEYRQTDTDIRFSDAVTWALISGCYFLKHIGSGFAFKALPVHPVNMGVLSESIVGLDEQECICHVTFPTMSRLESDLLRSGHPRAEAIIKQIRDTKSSNADDQQEPSYFHQMIIGGMNPLGDIGGTPSAGGIVQVFPTPKPWRPQRRVAPTVKHCELWIRDRKRDGDYTTIQMIYGEEPIILEGDNTRKNISGMPGHQPFVKVTADETPGYFWGRTAVANVQMLQDLITKRLRDLKVMWDRNAAAPKLLSGFQSITEEQYYKIISEGGFINDPNPNAKAQDLASAPQQGYLEELEFLWQAFDEAGGFSKVMTGQGESGVRAGSHAQTLVRQSSPALIDPATRIERQLAESGYLGLKLMQDRDPHIYTTDSGQTQFQLSQLPEPFQVEVDSHSASPAFAEDSRQIAIALARAQAVSAEDLIEMLHPPNAELLLARLRARQQQQAKMMQQEHQEMIAHGINPEQPGGGKGGGRRH